MYHDGIRGTRALQRIFYTHPDSLLPKETRNTFSIGESQNILVKLGLSTAYQGWYFETRWSHFTGIMYYNGKFHIELIIGDVEIRWLVKESGKFVRDTGICLPSLPSHMKLRSKISIKLVGKLYPDQSLVLITWSLNYSLNYMWYP